MVYRRAMDLNWPVRYVSDRMRLKEKGKAMGIPVSRLEKSLFTGPEQTLNLALGELSKDPRNTDSDLYREELIGISAIIVHLGRIADPLRLLGNLASAYRRRGECIFTNTTESAFKRLIRAGAGKDPRENRLREIIMGIHPRLLDRLMMGDIVRQIPRTLKRIALAEGLGRNRTSVINVISGNRNVPEEVLSAIIRSSKDSNTIIRASENILSRAVPKKSAETKDKNANEIYKARKIAENALRGFLLCRNRQERAAAAKALGIEAPQPNKEIRAIRPEAVKQMNYLEISKALEGRNPPKKLAGKIAAFAEAPGRRLDAAKKLLEGQKTRGFAQHILFGLARQKQDNVVRLEAAKILLKYRDTRETGIKALAELHKEGRPGISLDAAEALFREKDTMELVLPWLEEKMRKGDEWTAALLLEHPKTQKEAVSTLGKILLSRRPNNPERLLKRLAEAKIGGEAKKEYTKFLQKAGEEKVTTTRDLRFHFALSGDARKKARRAIKRNLARRKEYRR